MAFFTDFTPRGDVDRLTRYVSAALFAAVALAARCDLSPQDGRRVHDCSASCDNSLDGRGCLLLVISVESAVVR
jgi:hypothetical protein